MSEGEINRVLAWLKCAYNRPPGAELYDYLKKSIETLENAREIEKCLT